MDTSEARQQIMKAFDDYDEGRITRKAFAQVVETIVDELFEAAFNEGMEGEEVMFEADLDLNDDDFAGGSS